MTVAERMFGQETEYAFNALDRRTGRQCRSAGLNSLMELAIRDLPHLKGLDCGGIFLPAGRLYVDSGLHPEFSTAECTNPWDVVRYLLAGDRLVSDLSQKVAAESDSLDVSVFKCNVDYWDAESTWGCHESYLHRRHPAEMPAEIIPHLVSRIVYTGAGGFDSKSVGLEFMLSPRVAHLISTISGNSTRGRAIHHTKNESLSTSGYHRLHIICGESLCSHTAMWLKAGTTALVVAMADAGLRPGRGVQLARPLDAMRAYAADPTCRATATAADGRELSALDIQRHYQQMASRHAGARFMPPWAEQVCQHWAGMLDRLANGAPESVATTLDWAIKLALFSARVERRSPLTWDSLGRWTYILTKLRSALRRRSPHLKLRAASVLASTSGIADRVRRLTPLLAAGGLSWDGLEPLLQVRSELLEIDTRFAQLGEGGIFSAMDRAGVLDHAMAGVDNIEHAVENPPVGGRAAVRGAYIRKLAEPKGRYRCNWRHIVDTRRHRYIDLQDPFTAKADWRRLPPDRVLSGELGLFDQARRRLNITRARRRVERRGDGGELRRGDRIIITGLPNREVAASLYGSLARVRAVDRTGDGPRYRLDADDGHFPWPAETLCLLCRPGRG